MESVIHTRGLGRSYGSLKAVADIDIDVSPGTMLGVVGPDASGKTTLLQMLAGILDPTHGDCRVLGFDTRSDAKRISSRLGYMSQGFTLYDRLTVDENLRFAARIRNIDSQTYSDRRGRLLAMAGLQDFTGRQAGRLSGGMRKKLSLITNLVHEPSLLILDEPGLGVDPLSRRQLWEMLQEFQERGITVVVGTSYMDEADRCDRVMLLRKGRCMALDTPDALRGSVIGQSFEAIGGTLSEVARSLDAITGVRGIQWLPDRIRFVIDRGYDSRELTGRLPVDTGIRPATPALEDLFVIHADRDKAHRVHLSPVTGSRIKSVSGIKASGIQVRFGDFYAVAGVDLDVPPGRLLALLGPNGSGKTTLIKTLCGLLPLAGGTAEVAGVPISANNAQIRRRIGYMSQKYSLYRDLTPAENLVFFGNAYELGGKNLDEAIEQVGALVGITRLEEKPTDNLSGATQQRLALACSLLHRPPVLFLDEPTSGVDPVSRYRFWRLIRALADGGMTILVTTHYLDEAEYCDYIGLMLHGRMIAQGTGASLRKELNLGTDSDMERVFVTAIEHAGAAV